MTVYALRKRDGQWMICSAESATMLFKTYEEALEIARKAAATIARSAHGPVTENAEVRTQKRYH